MAGPPGDARGARAAHVLHWPVLVAAVVVLPAIAVEVLAADPWRTGAVVLVEACWVVFCLEVVVMLAVVRERMAWLRQHRLEVAVVLLSSPLLPVLGGAALVGQTLRLAKALRAAKGLKLVKAVKLLKLAKVRRLLVRGLPAGRTATLLLLLPAAVAVAVVGSWVGPAAALVAGAAVAVVALGRDRGPRQPDAVADDAVAGVEPATPRP